MAFTAIEKKIVTSWPVEAQEHIRKVIRLTKRLAKKNDSVGLTQAYDLCYTQMVDFQRRK